MARFLILLALVFFPLVAHAETTMERMVRTKDFNCGYIEYQPALVKDLKTNEWSGFNYDVLKQVTERLELNLVFSQPTGWGMVTADLLARKFDVMCTGYWVHPHMAKYVLFSRPFAFQPVFLAVRADDQRFKVGVNLNDPNLTMVALDGDNPVNIAKADFPKAKILALPNTTNFSDVLISVETKKADFTIVDPHTFGAYNEKNPGKMKILVDRPAMRIYPVSYIFRAEDYVLRDAVNIALEEMILDGSMDKIFDQYNQYDHGFYRAVVPMVNPYKVKK